MSFPPSLLAARPCAEYREPPVRANRGCLFLSAAGGFRPQLGSMEFGFWGLRRVGREGDALLVPGGQREVIEAALLVFLSVQFR